MRITNQLQFANFDRDYKRDSKLLSKYTAQISSGHKIQNSYDDSSVYIDSSRLEYEKTSLSQVKSSSQSAQTFADNSDTILNEFNSSLTQFKTKLIQAANGSHDNTSLNAIANDLDAIKTNLMDLANSSINGKFLFSGTAFSVKPIDSNGNYKGNDKSITATTGAESTLAYNIDGKSLFLGSDGDYKKILSTNIKLYNDDNQTPIKSSDTIKSLFENNGNNNGSIGSQTDSYFYIQGKNSDGSSFKKKININVNDTVDTLLDNIKNSFNPPESVSVTLNDFGQIEITDKNDGSKLMDFSMIGAIDKDGGSDADVNDIDDLYNNDSGLTLTPPEAHNNIISFVQSGYIESPDASNEAVSFDRNYFSIDGNKLTSNIPQIDKNTNEFATAKTRLVDASGLSSLDGVTLDLKLDQIDGTAQNSVQIDLKSSGSGGSTFTIGGNTYNIYDADGSVVDADNMTYQQLNDVVAMIVSNNLPATNDKSGYDTAVQDSKGSVDVSLDYRGRMQITDKQNASTKIKFSIYDSSSDNFGSTTGNALSFMSNNAIDIDKPSVDFFKDLDDMIAAVREGKLSPDGTYGDKRNLGIENSIRRIDHVRDHVSKLHTKIGSLSNALNSAYQRSDMLELHVTTLQSQIADTDIGEVLAKYNQINVGFQALLSTIAKTNSISLLNYL